MIPKVNNRGSYFKGLSDYLEGNQQRVVWTETHNLVFEERDMVVRRMHETAQLSDRVEKPVEHISVSFDKQDQITQEQQREVADQLLEGLGLQDYQTRIVAHNDRDFAHFHMVINRVHPTEGKAWDYPFYKKELQELSREIEREYGLRELGKQAQEISMSQNRFHMLRKEGREPFEKTVQKEHWEDFKQAKNWEDLQNRLAVNDIQIVAGKRGSGGKVVRGTEQANLSSVHRSFSAGKLANRFGETLQDFRKREEKAIHRAQETGYKFGIKRTDIALYERGQQILRSHEHIARQIEDKNEIIRAHTKKLKGLFTEAYQNPEQAWNHYRQDIKERGVSSAIEDLHNEPGRYGKLTYSWINRSIEDEARAAARQASGHTRIVGRAETNKTELENHLDTFSDRRNQAEQIVAQTAPHIEEMRAQAKTLRADYQHALKSVGSYYKANSITETVEQRLDGYKGGKGHNPQSFFQGLDNPLTSAKTMLQRTKKNVQRDLRPPGLEPDRGRSL